MSDKKYSVQRADNTFFSTYEEAEVEAKRLAARGNNISSCYDRYGLVFYENSVRDPADYLILESIALAKEPIPDVEVVKIT